MPSLFVFAGDVFVAELGTPDPPTQPVAGQPVEAFGVLAHPVPLLSLAMRSETNPTGPAPVFRWLLSFASRGAMDIDGLGEKTCQARLDAGLKSPPQRRRGEASSPPHTARRRLGLAMLGPGFCDRIESPRFESCGIHAQFLAKFTGTARDIPFLAVMPLGVEHAWGYVLT